MNKLKLLTVILLNLTTLYVHGQNLEVLYFERNEALFQNGPSSLIPVTQQFTESDWYDFSVFAGISLLDASATSATLTPAGGGGPLTLVPWDSTDYELEVGFNSRADMVNTVINGTYTYSGTLFPTGNQVGIPFTETLDVDTYVPVAPKRLTNYAELQAFDPAQPLTISWQPFSDLNGKDGFIEVSVGFWDGLSYHDIWMSEPAEGSFGLDPSTTSVQVPAGVITGSPFNYYDVNILFIRIESMDTPTTPAFAEGVKAVVSSFELAAGMQADLDAIPPRTYLQVGTWQDYPGLGNIFGYSIDWGYSPHLGFVNVSRTPTWVYQNNVGYLALFFGNNADHVWAYGPGVDWIYIIGEGQYADKDGNLYNMINQ